MFEITEGPDGEIVLEGRFGAQQVERANEVFLALSESRVVDCSMLEYIASAGLGVLLAAQKNLTRKGCGLKLVNLSSHIRDVFRFAGFDQIFEIEG